MCTHYPPTNSRISWRLPPIIHRPGSVKQNISPARLLRVFRSCSVPPRSERRSRATASSRSQRACGWWRPAAAVGDDTSRLAPGHHRRRRGRCGGAGFGDDNGLEQSEGELQLGLAREPQAETRSSMAPARRGAAGTDPRDMGRDEDHEW